jgi:hypothetical protein
MLLRCISHDNVGANSSGFIVDDGRLVDCIADTNGSEGFNITASTLGVSLVNCDAYNNTGDGFDMTGGSSTTVYMENCNAIKNGGWGINSSGSSVRNGVIINCGFGAGTQANTSGTINTNTGAIAVSGTVTYASNAIPYVDAPNGDFRITLSTAKNAGRGAFTQIAGSYAGTIGYPDIGAAQHIDSGGGASSYAFGG